MTTEKKVMIRKAAKSVKAESNLDITPKPKDLNGAPPLQPEAKQERRKADQEPPWVAGMVKQLGDLIKPPVQPEVKPPVQPPVEKPPVQPPVEKPPVKVEKKSAGVDRQKAGRKPAQDRWIK